jgi:hypothetical protein
MECPGPHLTVLKATFSALGLHPHVQTGSSGYHVYFRHPGWRVPTLNSTSKRAFGQGWPGLDIRADGAKEERSSRKSDAPHSMKRLLTASLAGGVKWK